eukprot:SAG22_NODE_295_length_12850_cov_9.179202_7_plen_242_part_00
MMLDNRPDVTLNVFLASKTERIPPRPHQLNVQAPQQKPLSRTASTGCGKNRLPAAATSCSRHTPRRRPILRRPERRSRQCRPSQPDLDLARLAPPLLRRRRLHCHCRRLRCLLPPPRRPRSNPPRFPTSRQATAVHRTSPEAPLAAARACHLLFCLQEVRVFLQARRHWCATRCRWRVFFRLVLPTREYAGGCQDLDARVEREGEGEAPHTSDPSTWLAGTSSLAMEDQETPVDRGQNRAG